MVCRHIPTMRTTASLNVVPVNQQNYMVDLSMPLCLGHNQLKALKHVSADQYNNALPTDVRQDEKFGKAANREQWCGVTRTLQCHTDEQKVHKLVH